MRPSLLAPVGDLFLPSDVATEVIKPSGRTCSRPTATASDKGYSLSLCVANGCGEHPCKRRRYIRLLTSVLLFVAPEPITQPPGANVLPAAVK